MRIVLFIVKSFAHILSGYIQSFISFFEYSFSFKKPLKVERKNNAILKIDEEDLAEINIRSWVDNEACIIGIGASPENYYDFDRFYALACLESLRPLLREIASKRIEKGIIVFYWMSKVPRSISAKSIARAFKYIKYLQIHSEMQIIIIDNQKLLGNKNSALLKRYFLHSCDQ